MLYDDIVLLARSAVELQAMLDVVTVYAQQWRFELNHRKSNVVVMGTSAQKLQSASSGWVLGVGNLRWLMSTSTLALSRS